jgi:protein-tyrosine-phosphatase
MGASDPVKRRRILLVCYGNICRSPVAEALLRRALDERGLGRLYGVRSAGVGAQPGTPAARGMAEVARTAGIDLGAHRARRLTPEMAREVDVLVAFDEVVEEEIAILAGDLPVLLWAVDDPYGGSATDYRRAFDEIAARVDRYVATLQAGEPQR